MKKRHLNGRRTGKKALVQGEEEKKAEETRGEGDVDNRSDLIGYLQMVTSIVEGREVESGEIEERMEEVLRQHSIDKGKSMHYARKKRSGGP